MTNDQHPLPEGTLVKITDPVSGYSGRTGVIKSHFDGRPAGGRVAYTVQIDCEGSRISFAATEDRFEVIADAWSTLAGFRGLADRCTCSDDQLAHVGCECEARQNLPVQCKCGTWLREPIEINAGECRGCFNEKSEPPEPNQPDLWLGPEFADEVSLEERWDHYAFEERNGLPYGSSF